jgi:hypothetical protein
MKTFISLFLSSGTFSAAISLVYWFSSKDITGTLFLGLMMLAFAWVAVYSKIAEAGSDLAGDNPETTHAQRAGEDIGIVTKATPWSFLLAVCIVTSLAGAVWSAFVLFAGFGGVLLCLWRLGAESARAGNKRIFTEEGEETVT